MSELGPSDPLSCLAALQLLQHLSDTAGSPAARLLWDLLLPRLPPLLRDADTAPGALPVAARLLGQAAVDAAGPGAHGVEAVAAANSNGNGSGVAAMALDHDEEAGARQLLHHMVSLLDDRCASARSRALARCGCHGLCVYNGLFGVHALAFVAVLALVRKNMQPGV